jgi:diguanylate cyclase (GGDEF)-like protein
MSEIDKNGVEPSAIESFTDGNLTIAELRDRVAGLERWEVDKIVFGLASVIKVQKLRQEGLINNLHRDRVTGILNRAGLEDRYAESQKVKRQTDTPLPGVVVMLDIDNFKKINDSRGHAEGDKLLRRSAEIIEFAVRGGDAVGRCGGDEFIALLRNTELDGGLAVAKRILERREALVPTDSSMALTGFSIGIAPIDYSKPFKQVYEPADLAMYAAKENGGGQVCVSDQIAA